MVDKTSDYLLRIQLDIQGDKAMNDLLRSMEKVSKAQPKVQKGFKKTQIEARQFGRGLQNAGYQVQDFIVQVSGGVDPLRSLSQQLPQLLINMGALGAIIGTVAAGLPILISYLNSISDATVGWDKSVEKLNETLEESSKSWSAYEEALGRLEDTGSAVDTVIAKLLETIASTEQQAALKALKDSAKSLVESARELEKLPAAEESGGGFLGWLKNLAAEVKAVNTGGDLAGIAAQAKEIGDVATELDRFGGGGFLAEFQETINNLNSQNIDQTIVSLTNLADRMEGVASPDAVDRIRQMALSLNDLRLQSTETAESVDKVTSGVLRLVQATGEYLNLSAPLLDELAYQNQLYAELNPEIAAYQQEQFKLNEALRVGAINTDEFNVLWEQMEKNFAESQLPKVAEEFSLLDEGMALFGKNFDTMLNGVLMGTQSISDGFRDMARVVLAQLAKLAATQFIGNFLSGQGGFLGQVGANLLGNAKGNAFSNGSLTAFANGGVVSKPTVFPMADGAGLMGEKGAEAVMPLRRGANGKLGVESTGMNVVINNNAPGVSVNARQGDDGLTIDVVMRQLTNAISQGGNDITQALEGTYSLGRGRAVY